MPPISKACLSDQDKKDLVAFSEKHKIYPYRYRFNKLISTTAFNKTAAGPIQGANPGLGSYFTLSFTPKEITPIIYIATSFIVLPNTSVDIFALVVSYNSTISFADNVNAGLPDDEAQDTYQLLSNGGAINDFQVFYPVNWFLERGRTIYMHVYAGPTVVAAASSYIVGHFILGTLPTGA
ncbi:MAG TPA: hypothetical protein VN915_06780 [Elusimicrobiota bacterium]|nr:hypothetical protein [Elusimicrobiota bacterium]